jgi:hypothetical protein
MPPIFVRAADRSTYSQEIPMLWFLRYLTYAPARQLLRECAAQTIAEYGGGAVAKLRSEIEIGTPFSGRLLMWLMIHDVRSQHRCIRREASLGRALRAAGR